MEHTLDRLLAAPDITDSTDFPDTTHAPGLRGLDDALRCNICRDFYDAPVSLSCGHSFCSVCVRSALPVNATCPSCRKPASEGHLRKNTAVESAVNAWKVARPLILRLSKDEHERKTRPPAPDARRRDLEPPHKRKRSVSPLSVSDDEIVALPPGSSPAPSGSATPDMLPGKPAISPPYTVGCPICQKAVPSQKINMHIDSSCKRYLAEGSTPSTAHDPKGKQKQQWSKLLGVGGGGSSSTSHGHKSKDKGKGKSRCVPSDDDDTEPEHIPKVAYDIHPQKRIAEMLSEWGLPTHGEKGALARRHSKWIVLYNANVDRAPENRRTLEQLRSELRQIEEAERKTRKQTVDDPVAYQKANKAAFAKLTEAARPKKTSNVKKDEEEPIPQHTDVRGSPVESGATEDSEGRTGVNGVIDIDSS
ncbi:hypothetical protein BD413DRAFT_462819 [Trametes elegans]|nr:hypothetical protein BD413DRAFT_462819 [Trametes elegans]